MHTSDIGRAVSTATTRKVCATDRDAPLPENIKSSSAIKSKEREGRIPKQYRRRRFQLTLEKRKREREKKIILLPQNWSFSCLIAPISSSSSSFQRTRRHICLSQCKEKKGGVEEEAPEVTEAPPLQSGVDLLRSSTTNWFFFRSDGTLDCCLFLENVFFPLRSGITNCFFPLCPPVNRKSKMTL